ncbi:MAG: tRNA-specific 2-thiouridylase MnmA [Elusimicrobia bacterium]|nr:tRNA-specific 2-thiouridylase MnmA [Elusimicrobiota bacterium]
MSGGVDSSVAAALLAEQGHEVIGVTLRLLPKGGEGFGCCGAPEDLLIAKRSAERAGVPHYVLDYSPEFEDKVINYFVNSYVAGETPNPCLACNRYIKFDKLKKFADSLNANLLATGHYARIQRDDQGFHLYEAVDPSKDQSYVLYNFNQTGLSSTLFPVGDKPKTEIRELARKLGLPNADKKDSQEICFVPRKDYRSYVKIRLEKSGEAKPSTTQPGAIKNSAGQVIGEHKGVAYYTIGQRSGLAVNTSEKTYVTHLDAATNTVVVGSDQENLAQGLWASDFNWIQDRAPSSAFEVQVKIRYKHEPTPARISVEGNRIKVIFNEPQRAVSPGQAAVVYRWDEKMKAREVLGGGKILESLR